VLAAASAAAAATTAAGVLGRYDDTTVVTQCMCLSTHVDE